MTKGSPLLLSPTFQMTTASGSDYKKLSHREHILELPDTYVGSVETHEEWRWVLDADIGIGQLKNMLAVRKLLVVTA